MCAVNAYNKEHVPMTDDESSGGDRPFSIFSSKGALILIGHNINFNDNWLKYFEDHTRKY